MADELKIAGIMEKLMQSAVDCGLPNFVEIAKRLWVNDAALIEEYSDQAALFAYCSSQYELNKVALKEAEATSDNEVRIKLGSAAEKITEQKVAMLVGSTSAVVLLRKKVAMLTALTEAFKQRTQMLISIGADRREEQRGTEMPLPREDRSAILDDLQKRVINMKGTTPLQRKTVREETEGKKKIPLKKIIKKN